MTPRSSSDEGRHDLCSIFSACCESDDLRRLSRLAGCGDGSAAGDAIGEQADADGVRMRAVVVEQRVVVAVDEEMPRRAGDERRVGQSLVGSGPPVGRRTPSSCHVAERQRDGHVARRLARAVARVPTSLAIRWRASGDTVTSRPQRLAGGPAVALQVVGDRREDVRRRRPDVAPAVTVEVLGELQIARRHELRLTHRAGPRALACCASSMSPRLRISSASNSSPRKNVERRGSQASVASAAIVGRTPLNRPKFDSMPQMATMMRGGHAVTCADLVEQRRGAARTSRARSRPTSASGAGRGTVSSDSTVSACVRSRSMTTGSGSSMLASASSTISWRMPRVSASARTPASHSANDGRGVSGGRGASDCARSGLQAQRWDQRDRDPEQRSPSVNSRDADTAELSQPVRS